MLLQGPAQSTGAAAALSGLGKSATHLNAPTSAEELPQMGAWQAVQLECLRRCWLLMYGILRICDACKQAEGWQGLVCVSQVDICHNIQGPAVLQQPVLKAAKLCA